MTVANKKKARGSKKSEEVECAAAPADECWRESFRRYTVEEVEGIVKRALERQKEELHGLFVARVVSERAGREKVALDGSTNTVTYLLGAQLGLFHAQGILEHAVTPYWCAEFWRDGASKGGGG